MAKKSGIQKKGPIKPGASRHATVSGSLRDPQPPPYLKCWEEDPCELTAPQTLVSLLEPLYNLKMKPLPEKPMRMKLKPLQKDKNMMKGWVPHMSLRIPSQKITV